VPEADVEQLRRGYEAFNRGDFESALVNVAEDFVAADRKEVPDPRTYRGLDEARRAFLGVGGDFDEYSFEPIEFIDGGDWIVAVLVQRGRGRLSGAEVEGEISHLWRLRDGKVTELRAFSTREEALAAAKEG
jgi:uncharacterized protein